MRYILLAILAALVLSGCTQTTFTFSTERTETGLQLQQRVNVLTTNGIGEASRTMDVDADGNVTKQTESSSTVGPGGIGRLQIETFYEDGLKTKTIETRSFWNWSGPAVQEQIEQVPEVPKLPPGQLQL